MSEMIDDLSTLVAKQKLVPFLGAGCSASMLPDWDALMDEMAIQLEDTSDMDNLEIAQKYVDTFGRDSFCDVLKSKLEVSDFDDDKGYIHLTIMNMGVPAIYTTNQDNVMEMGYRKYGKRFRTIVKLTDFAEAKLSEQLYIKFHGDLNFPDSIVFTKEDYRKRISNPNHPLNIRMRADLLAKNLLFVGYSFRDINIRQMFAELQEAFYGELPTSYMIAYRYSDELQSICDEYGITLIDPMKECPEFGDNEEAFKVFLKNVMEEARVKRFNDEMQEFITPTSTRPIKVISKQEIELLIKTVDTDPFSVGLNLFREICDASDIPADFEDQIVDVYIKLSQKVKSNKDTESLSAALFNLRLEKPLNQLTVVASLMASSNVREAQSKYGDDRFFISSKYGKWENYIVLAAKAIELVYEWGWKPTPPFSWNVGQWIDDGIDFEILPNQLQQYVTHWVDKMRKDCRTVAEHPIKRQQRLKEFFFNNSSDNLSEDEIKLLCEIANVDY